LEPVEALAAAEAAAAEVALAAAEVAVAAQLAERRTAHRS